MKSEGLLKHFAVAFLLALIGYLLFYEGIEHRRTRKGPWEVAFTHNLTGAPAIIINQPTIGITNVQICFAGETLTHSASNSLLGLTNTILRFDQPHPVPLLVPFGKCLFMDTTFLPGTVTFQLLGHEIELLPRVLIIDFQEHPWQSGTTIALPTTNRQPQVTM